jgi:hypothetical protein
VAALEILLQWRIPHGVPSPEDWKAAADSVIAQKQEGELVLIAPAWATQGRMYLGPAIELADFGRFGISRYNRIFELSVDGARDPDTEGLELESEESHGLITVRRLRTGGAAQVLYDFLAESGSAHCQGSGCQGKRVVIDHWFNPRLAVPVALKPKPVSVIYEDVPLGGVIHGHAVIGYREGRFDVGGPVDLKVYVDGRLAGSQQVRNFGPLETFVFPVNREGTGQVRFDVVARDGFKREFSFAADMRKAVEP